MKNKTVKAFIATLAAAAFISGCGKETPSTLGTQSGNKASLFFNPLYFNGYLLDPSGRANGPADWPGKTTGSTEGDTEENTDQASSAVLSAEDEEAYEKGYEKGLADALNVVNKNSASYLKGLEAGKQEVSSTVDINSASYKSGYDAGMKYVHDTKTLDPDDPNYKAGYDDGYKDGTKDGNTTVQPGSDEYNVIYEKGYKDAVKEGGAAGKTTTVTNGDSYKKGYEDGLKAAAGKSDSSSQSYKDGYKKGQDDADKRTNPDSENYKSGQESVTLSIKAKGDTVTATASNGKALSTKVDAASILKTDLTGTSGSQDGDFSLNAGEYATVLQGWVSDKRVIQASTLSSQTQGTALAKDVLSGKTVWVGGIQLTGSMPDYPAIDETSGAKTTEEWTASGLSKDNSTGIITVADGYHAESKIIGASGEAADDQVLEGTTYSSKTGAHTGTMPNHGQVKVSFTKAAQTAHLDSGYYQGITFDTDAIYQAGLNDALAAKHTSTSYSTVIRVDPGEHGKFADGTTEVKSFSPPDYAGITMDVQPANGMYFLSGWGVSTEYGADNAAMTYKAQWSEKQPASMTYDNAFSGSYSFDGMCVNKITVKFRGSKVQHDWNNSWTSTVNGSFDVLSAGQKITTITLTGSAGSTQQKYFNSIDNRDIYTTTSSLKAENTYATADGALLTDVVINPHISYTNVGGDAECSITVEGYKK